MTKDPRVYLAQILECCEKIRTFTVGGRSPFMDDAMVQDAVIRNFMIIGEATKRLDDAYRAAHPHIPWRSLAAFRDVLVHQYDVIDTERVWSIIENDLLDLMKALDDLLPPLDQLERELAGETEETEST